FSLFSLFPLVILFFFSLFLSLLFILFFLSLSLSHFSLLSLLLFVLLCFNSVSLSFSQISAFYFFLGTPEFTSGFTLALSFYRYLNNSISAFYFLEPFL